MKSLFYIIATLFLLLFSCTDNNRQTAMLVQADSIADRNPDSALIMLKSIKPLIDNSPAPVRYRYLMIEAKAMNKAYVPFTSDSTMKKVVRYYDKHGSDNERMLAHYLLGCVYRDLDSIPLALQCYEDAAEMADTTDEDCDYATLSYIHGQRAELFSKEWIPQDLLKASELCYKYAMKAKDTLTALNAYDYSSNAYYLLNESKKEIEINENVSILYEKYGYKHHAAIALGALVFTYTELDDFKNAARCMKRYECESGCFDKNSNIKKGKEIYYFFKSIYFLGINRTDSAIIYLKKLQHADKQTLNTKIAMAHGLSLYYKKLGKSDSTAKYALLSYELDDSLCTHLMRSSCSTIQAQYDHNKLQNEINKKELKAQRATNTALVIAIILIIVVFSSFLIIRRRRELAIKQKQQLERDNETLLQAQMSLQAMLAQTQEERNTIAEEYKKTISELTLRQKKVDTATVEERLHNSEIAKKFKQIADTPNLSPDKNEWHELRSMFNREIPQFYSTVNSRHTLRPDEYDLCMLVRLNFKTLEMSNLMHCSKQNISAMRRRMLQKMLGHDGSPKEFDEFIMGIIE